MCWCRVRNSHNSPDGHIVRTQFTACSHISSFLSPRRYLSSTATLESHHETSQRLQTIAYKRRIVEKLKKKAVNESINALRRIFESGTPHPGKFTQLQNDLRSITVEKRKTCNGKIINIGIQRVTINVALSWHHELSKRLQRSVRPTIF